MAKKLSDSLSQFISSNSSTFDNPYDEDSSGNEEHVDMDAFVEEQKEIKKEKKKKKDDLDKFLEDSKKMSERFGFDSDVDDFEEYLEEYFLDDEDEELKNSLIKYGRKYARDTKVTGESSEISKAYAEAEEVLGTLLKEVNEDKDSIQKDITQMRANRSRNYKVFSEMIEQRTTLHNTALGIVKELNAMTKSKFDIQMKANKQKQEEDGDNSAANRAIQSLFGLGRDSLIGSYSDVSGSLEAGTLDDYDYNEADTIHEKYFSDEEEEDETDGDKFLKYEGMGVHYVLEYDNDGPIQIVAEDMDGNVVPDYPIPNMEDLEFHISENTGTATDNLTQQYKLRRV
jgi:hypothetical protein